MRAPAIALVAIVAILGVPLASSTTVCTPYIVARACLGVSAGGAAAVDVYLVTPADWRSAHVAGGTYGAGASLHGNGIATGGPLDVYAGATTGGPYAGAYFCIGLPPYLPSTCGDPVYHVMRLVPTLP